MLSKDTLPQLLDSLGFTAHGAVHEKFLDGARLAIDLGKGEIHYPEDRGLTINERQTCNFSSNENFVVFECVHRLLEKGYKPEHIELEPKWKLGHGASGGRADILIKDNQDKPLLLIECKTAGREFDKAWRETQQDGAQLFSYAQQEPETQFLCLYASDMGDDGLRYQSIIIAHRDNPDYLRDNPTLKGFAQATDLKARFAIWRDTYKLDHTTRGIFEPNIQPYHIGKDKYGLADLHAISAQDQQRKYHEFATILRQHNVSGRENAFDKLVNLFLCKLVDEIQNKDDLKFYWKGVAYDTHFDLLDRLQQLYKEGMGQFLGEDITYINQSDVQNAMRYIRQDPDATQRAVWNLFIQQKFFTNNDFSFIDVHNERLFYQNADVLLKIIQMWQDIRLTSPDGYNQFLGDMFEGFLDQGVKQSEGQYFTPMPICRFIMSSLPLASLVRNRPQPPRAVDYACGAGHFLNELALQLKPLLPEKADPALYHQAIYGIEKEYRLSKVAKVSAFMYGQQNINICYGDALRKHHDAFPEIRDDSFDILVANPPYSVRGFLETLPDDDRDAYALTATVNDLETANSIETFFIERAQQLLTARGVAAIILPSSVLSNGGTTYIKAREILLQHSDIVAIAEFGSGTFGKTGTNTVTLFLRRKPTRPDAAEHYRERIRAWFAGNDFQGIYQDGHLIDAYAAHIGVAADDYRSLLNGTPNAALLAHDTFTQYRKAFDARADIARRKNQKAFKALSKAEQDTGLHRLFLDYAQGIERDKLLHFVLAHEQPNPVLIIKSPTDTKEQKRFLGYEWSAAKGDEGIKLAKDARGRHLTPLYDETDRYNPDKIARLISDTFDGLAVKIPEALAPYASQARLVDMLDFSRVTFEKQIALTQKNSVVIWSKRYPMEKLAHLNTMLRRGKSAKYGNSPIQIIKSGQARGHFEFDFSERHYVEEGFTLDERQLQPGDLLINSTGKGTAGRVTYFDLPGVFVVDSHVSILRPNARLHPKFGLYSLARIGFKALEGLADGASGQVELTLETIGAIQIPLPPMDVQKTIVAECEAVDTETGKAQADRQSALAAIEDLVNAVYASAAPRVEIDKFALAVQYGLSEKMNETGVGYKIFRMNEIERGRMVDGGAMKYADISAEEFQKFRLNKGDLLFNRTNSIEHVGKTGLFDLDGEYCYASYLVRIVPDTAKVHPHFLALMMNAAPFQQLAKSKASKSINQANINASIMRNLPVPLPTCAEQQRIVDESLTYERAITQAQAIINAAPARKAAILSHYLD